MYEYYLVFFFFFLLGGKFFRSSYWSLSCDHGLHCRDELLWERHTLHHHPLSRTGRIKIASDLFSFSIKHLDIRITPETRGLGLDNMSRPPQIRPLVLHCPQNKKYCTDYNVKNIIETGIWSKSTPQIPFGSFNTSALFRWRRAPHWSLQRTHHARTNSTKPWSHM